MALGRWRRAPNDKRHIFSGRSRQGKARCHSETGLARSEKRCLPSPRGPKGGGAAGGRTRKLREMEMGNGSWKLDGCGWWHLDAIGRPAADAPHMTPPLLFPCSHLSVHGCNVMLTLSYGTGVLRRQVAIYTRQCTRSVPTATCTYHSTHPSPATTPTPTPTPAHHSLSLLSSPLVSLSPVCLSACLPVQLPDYPPTQPINQPTNQLSIPLTD